MLRQAQVVAFDAVMLPFVSPWVEKRYKLFQTSQGCVRGYFSLIPHCRISFLFNHHTSFFRLAGLNGKCCALLTIVAFRG